MSNWSDCPRLERIDVELVDTGEQLEMQFATWPVLGVLHPNDLRAAAKALTLMANAKESGEIPHLGRVER